MGCSTDYYCVGPNRSWHADSRGWCLITEITANVQGPHGDVNAKSYKSTGTGFSQFAVISYGRSDFAVTRVV